MDKELELFMAKVDKEHNDLIKVCKEQAELCKKQLELLVDAWKVLQKIQDAPDYTSADEMQDWAREFLDTIHSDILIN